LFFSCASPRGGQIIQEEEISKEDSIAQQSDSLQVSITEEEIKKEMKFGVKEKTAAIVIGSYFGFILGLYIGGSTVGEGPEVIVPALIGGSIGLPVGAVANYFIVKSIAKRSAKKKALEKKQREESEEIEEK